MEKTLQQIYSWGRVKKIKANVYTSFLKNKINASSFIPFGNGRSYGDAALNETIVKTEAYKKVISFDKEKGIIHCESGILLSEILEKIVPNNWFLPVTPGTKFITLGGAVAADVHGKNHHNSGSFSRHIIFIKVLLPSGEIIECSRMKNTKLFKATCGGGGLTGVITEVCFSLKAIKGSYVDQQIIKTNTLKEAFETLITNSNSEYIVAWIDLLQKKSTPGIVILGKHSGYTKNTFTSKQKITVPAYFPSFLMNPISMKIYNWYYLKKQKRSKAVVSLNTFFYPLDNLKHWNRIYGKKGLVQYQFVIPKSQSFEAISEVIEKVKNSNYPSYLSVLKLLGPQNDNYLSFPKEGYTLSLDFKMKPGLYDFLKKLDVIVNQYNGRIYLAKDGRVSKEVFEKGYTQVATFRKLRERLNLKQMASLQSKRLGL